MLILMSKPASERGGTSDRAFMAFKLHQFFCGAGRLYSTLREPTAAASRSMVNFLIRKRKKLDSIRLSSAGTAGKSIIQSF